MKKAVVVGSGAVGLSMAIELLEAGWQVAVVGETLSPNTTSDGSGGYWRPVFLEMEESKLLGICEYSFKRMIEIMKGAKDVGMHLVSGYEFYKQDKEPEVPIWSKVVYGFRRALHDEIGTFGPPGSTHGFSYTTLILEPPRYMQWMMSRIVALGGSITQRRVSSLEEAATFMEGGASLVVNCAGLFGGRLAGDDSSVVPIRGQIIKVAPTKPTLSRFFLVDLTISDEVAYILPRDDCIVLGGTEQVRESASCTPRIACLFKGLDVFATHGSCFGRAACLLVVCQVGDWRETTDDNDSFEILRKCKAMLPGIEKSPILSQWAGG